MCCLHLEFLSFHFDGCVAEWSFRLDFLVFRWVFPDQRFTSTSLVDCTRTPLWHFICVPSRLPIQTNMPVYFRHWCFFFDITFRLDTTRLVVRCLRNRFDFYQLTSSRSIFQEISEAKNDLRSKGVMVDWCLRPVRAAGSGPPVKSLNRLNVMPFTLIGIAHINISEFLRRNLSDEMWLISPNSGWWFDTWFLKFGYVGDTFRNLQWKRIFGPECLLLELGRKCRDRKYKAWSARNIYLYIRGLVARYLYPCKATNMYQRQRNTHLPQATGLVEP